MKDILSTSVSRRGVLAGSAAVAGALAMPSILRAQDKSIKIGVYGGYFKDSFDKNIFPEFTKATGIAVESIAEPTVKPGSCSWNRPPRPARHRPISR